MRIANIKGRLGLMHGTNRFVDIEDASHGQFGPNPQSIFDRWLEFREWGASSQLAEGREVSSQDFDAVVPRPPQVFAVGLNYRDHAAESRFEAPDEPLIFTKFVSSFTGAQRDVELSPGNVDWEVELVAVIGIGGRNIVEDNAWEHVAGLTLGQDISDRVTQFQAPPAQFCLGKSYEGFSPLGPVLVTVDEFETPDDLEIGCKLNGEVMQRARTSQLIFSIPCLVSKLSKIVELLPGDVIFTGTPAGVGVGRKPQRFIEEMDELVSWCPEIGEMRHRFFRRQDATSSSAALV